MRRPTPPPLSWREADQRAAQAGGFWRGLAFFLGVTALALLASAVVAAGTIAATITIRTAIECGRLPAGLGEVANRALLLTWGCGR